MTPGSQTSEFGLVRLFIFLVVGGYLIFVAFVFWGFGSNAVQWEAAMDKLVEITTMIGKAAWAVVAFVLSRGGLKIAKEINGSGDNDKDQLMGILKRLEEKANA